MGLGISVFLIALGAILAFAVTIQPEGVNVNTVGWILMVVGATGALLALLLAGRARFGHAREEEQGVERDTA